MNDFDERWACVETRMKVVPGKEVPSALNGHLQGKFHVALSVSALITAFNQSEVPAKLVKLLTRLNDVRIAEMPEQPTLSFEGS